MRAQTIRQRLPNDKASSTGPLKEKNNTRLRTFVKRLSPIQ